MWHFITSLSAKQTCQVLCRFLFRVYGSISRVADSTAMSPATPPFLFIGMVTDYLTMHACQVGYSVPTNTYPITMTGSGADGKIRSTTYTLTVTSGAVPELPVGLAWEILLLPVVIYALWISKQRRAQVGTNEILNLERQKTTSI